MVDANLLRDGLCRAFIVPGNHNDLDAHFFQSRYGGTGRLLDRICHSHKSCILTVDSRQHSSLALGFKLRHSAEDRINRHVMLCHQLACADQHLMSFHAGTDAVAWNGFKMLRDRKPRSFASIPATIASASGCSELFSADPTRRRNSS